MFKSMTIFMSAMILMYVGLYLAFGAFGFTIAGLMMIMIFMVEIMSIKTDIKAMDHIFAIYSQETDNAKTIDDIREVSTSYEMYAASRGY